ncbi:MAG: FAD:protein FMN transferase [Pseudomonadota bacterium]|nr:thiamine biosynthesis protein ApbE [Pseudomonadales bacterium]MDY6918781.1 FAD:protein FMN transferase [Pseudomonadota bacterium]
MGVRGYGFTGYGFWLLLVWLIPAAAHARWFEQTQPIMGTRVYVQLWHEDAARAEALINQVMAEMERINQLMSPYLEHSQLARVNREAAQQPVAVSPELFELIATANRFSALSDGAFDITFASLGHRFNYRKGVRPSPQQAKTARELIDYRQLQLNPDRHTVGFARAGMRIDLGGIAKGHAVDRGIDLLRRAGVKHAIITAGGDSRLLGDHRGRPWILGIKHPRGESSVMKLPLENVAISTSGDYERYFEVDGVRYHHIIDPASGDSARGLISVSILAPRSLEADALSTTVFVLGAEQGLKLINGMPGISAILIDHNGQITYSNDLVDPSAP